MNSDEILLIFHFHCSITVYLIPNLFYSDKRRFFESNIFRRDHLNLCVILVYFWNCCARSRPTYAVLVLPKSTTFSWESFICYHNVSFYRKMVKIIYNYFQIKETKPGNNWYSYIKELYQCPCPQLSVYSFPHLTCTQAVYLAELITQRFSFACKADSK